MRRSSCSAEADHLDDLGGGAPAAVAGGVDLDRLGDGQLVLDAGRLQTIPMRSRRPGPAEPGSWPSTVTSPAERLRCPSRISTVVDLPAPLCPATRRPRPRRRRRTRRRRHGCRRSPCAGRGSDRRHALRKLRGKPSSRRRNGPCRGCALTPPDANVGEPATTIAAIRCRASASTRASVSTTGAVSSVSSCQYCSADSVDIVVGTSHSSTSSSPARSKRAAIDPRPAQRNIPGASGGGARTSTSAAIASPGIVAHGFAAGSAQTAAQTRPPGRVTRMSSATARSRSGKDISPKRQVTRRSCHPRTAGRRRCTRARRRRDRPR